MDLAASAVASSPIAARWRSSTKRFWHNTLEEYGDLPLGVYFTPPAIKSGAKRLQGLTVAHVHLSFSPPFDYGG